MGSVMVATTQKKHTELVKKQVSCLNLAAPLAFMGNYATSSESSVSLRFYTGQGHCSEEEG